MQQYLKLPFQFDRARLQQDLDALITEQFNPHFNTGYYNGDWSALPLRSIGGEVNHIYPDPTKKEDFKDTIYLERAPYISEILHSFGAPLQSARLLRLGAGSRIKKHRDFCLAYEDGEIRIHIPIVTNPDVEFYLEDERIIMNEGECWYLNFNLNHRVENNGSTDRIHLVFDCFVNDHIHSLFETASV